MTAGAGVTPIISKRPARPKPCPVELVSIPPELRVRDQWVLWRYGFRDGLWTKIPYQTNGDRASADDPATWTTFEAVWTAYEQDLERIRREWDGIGYEFAADDPYAGVDIDRVKGDPEREAWALSIVARFGTYAEWSVSGTGLHLISKGAMPGGKGRNDQAKGLEAYSQGRFFTFTGNVVESPTYARIKPAQQHLDWLLEHEFKPAGAARTEVKLDRSTTALPIGDRDQRARERMYASKRGAEIQMLANGGSVHRKPDGSPDHSADDQSYVNPLAFWFDRDPARMAAEAMRSNRVRDKWFEVHSSDGSTYLEMTIGTAISGCSQSFRDLTGYDAGDEPPQLRISAPTLAPIGADETSTCWSTTPATLEDALALIERMRAVHQREIDEYRESNRDLIGWVERLAGLEEDRQTVIRGERERREALEQYVTSIDDVLARSDMSGTDKVMMLVATRELHTRLSKGIHTISRGRLADLAGVSESTVTTSLKRICTPEPKAGKGWEPDGRPFRRLVTRKHRTDPETGADMIVSSLEITPWQPTARETLRAAATFAVPEDQPKHGGSKVAVEASIRARRDGCRKHPEADVVMRGVCSECGDVLAERRMPTEEWSEVKEQLALSEPPRAPVDVVLKGEQLALSEAAEPPPPLYPPDLAGTPDVCTTHGRSLTPAEPKRGGCSWCEHGPPGIDEIEISPGREVDGPVCGYVKSSGRTCVASLYRDLGMGWGRCRGCGQNRRLLAAVAGGEK